MTRKVLSSALVPVLVILPFWQSPASLAAAPAQAQAPASPAPSPVPTLLDGTPVKLRLAQTVSSAEARVGQEIPFEVVEEVRVNDIVVLAKGGTAIATVTDAEPKKRMGRGGKLDMAISYARLIDGQKLALRGSKEGKGGSHTGAMTAGIVATSLIVWPAAPFFLFMHGKDISIPAGTEITAFIEGDMHLDLAKFGAAPSQVAAGTSTSAQVNLSVDSTPSGAEIEVDGNFVGSTPSTVPVSIGNHEITVKKKGYTYWTRKMNVAGGNVFLNAELERASQN